MLYMVGPLVFDTFPFSLNHIEREDSEDYAKHDLMSRRRGLETAGPGDDVLLLAGEFLPYHIGGLSELETARGLMHSRAPQYVMRGDGYALGWYVIEAIRESHADAIAPTGVAYKVKHEIKLLRDDDQGGGAGASLIGAILASLFG